MTRGGDSMEYVSEYMKWRDPNFDMGDLIKLSQGDYVVVPLPGGMVAPEGEVVEIKDHSGNPMKIKCLEVLKPSSREITVSHFVIWQKVKDEG